MKKSISVIAGAIVVLSGIGSAAFGADKDPLFGDQPAKPKPIPGMVESLTTEDMAKILNAANGLQAAPMKTDDGTKFVGVKAPNDVPLFLVPLCGEEPSCPIYRVFTPLVEGAVSGDVYLRFHASSFGAFLDRSKDGSATLLIDGLMLAGGVHPDNILNSMGMFLADLKRAQDALKQQRAQTSDRGKLKLTSGSKRPATSEKRKKSGLLDPVAEAYIDSLKKKFD